MPQQEEYNQYIVLATLTERSQNPQDLAAKWGEIIQNCEEIGVTVKDSFAVLGQFDFLILVEAPSRERLFDSSMMMGREGLDVQTMGAIPMEHFGDVVRDR